MIRVLVAACFIFLTFPSFSQKKDKAQKPQVLIYGHSADAFAAAVQAAQSSVQTIWIMDSTAIGGLLIQGEAKHVSANYKLDAGLWGRFLKELVQAKKISDSASTVAKRSIVPRIAQNVFEQFADSVDRLQIRKNMQITGLEKSGKNWEVSLNNKEKIKVFAIVDATDSASLYHFIAPEGFEKKTIKTKLSPSGQSLFVNYNDPLFRTGIAVSDIGGKAFSLPLGYLLPDSVLNYFATRSLSSTNNILSHTVNDLPLLMLMGQASGAAAAYCAVFKTTSDQLNIRKLQGEILAFRGELIPFQDITLDDPHFVQIQRIGITGLLKGNYEDRAGKILFVFQPDSLIASKEIEPIMKALYTRSQIWFKGKDIPMLHVADVLDLIKYVALRGNELDKEVQKGWQKRFHFQGIYDSKEIITRRQLAVLLDAFLSPQPFTVLTTLKGELRY